MKLARRKEGLQSSLHDGVFARDKVMHTQDSEMTLASYQVQTRRPALPKEPASHGEQIAVKYDATILKINQVPRGPRAPVRCREGQSPDHRLSFSQAHSLTSAGSYLQTKR